MKRYFIKKNDESLEVIVSTLMDSQPENSILFEPNNFKKPCFNQYPNPTEIVDGFDFKDTESLNSQIKEQRKQAYELEVDYLVNQYNRNLILGTKSESELLELKSEIEIKTNEINLKLPYYEKNY